MSMLTGKLRIAVVVTALMFSGGYLWLGQSGLSVWVSWIIGAVLFGAVSVSLLHWSMQPVESAASSDQPHFDESARVISQQTSRMAIGSAEVSYLVDRLHDSVDQNSQSADDIA